MMVVEGATGKVLGDIPNTPGVHGAGSRQTFLQRFRDLEPLQGEPLLHAFTQAPRCRLMIPLQEARQLFQPFLTPCGPQKVCPALIQ
jgi:hypothetical protein